MTFDAAAAEADLLRAAGLGLDPGLGFGPGPGFVPRAGFEPKLGGVPPTLGGIPLQVVGIGWATVEMDRAATELGTAASHGFETAEPDTLLGATARIGRGRSKGPFAILLEPFTEGRLAAFLARHGEGPAVLYLAPGAGALESLVGGLAAAGIRTRAGAGPLGPAALVMGRSADEPQLVLVAVPSEP